MFASEEASGAAEARLNFVENKCSAMTRGKFPRSHEIAGRRQVDAAFALDRLEEESGNLRSVASKARGQCVCIAEFDALEAGRKRPESLRVMRLSRQCKCAEGFAMKGAGRGEDDRPARAHADQLDRGFDRLGARRREKAAREITGSETGEPVGQLLGIGC